MAHYALQLVSKSLAQMLESQVLTHMQSWIKGLKRLYCRNKANHVSALLCHKLMYALDGNVKNADFGGGRRDTTGKRESLHFLQESF